MVTMQEEVQQIGSAYIKNKKDALLVIGLIHDGETHVFGFGDHPIQQRMKSEDVMFEIGSISKVFTTSMLAKMIQRKQMALDDSISLYCSQVRPNHPIQIEQLATHTSGLPSYYPIRNLQLLFLPKVKRDRYCQYSIDELIKLLHKKKWNQPKQFLPKYSNIGMGLLGLVMGWSLNQTYEQLLKEYIVDELNLTQTFVTMTDEMKDQAIEGHRANGKVAPPIQMIDFQGAGAIRSSISDLLVFLSAHLEADDESPWKMTHEPRVKIGKNMSMGLGWVIDDSGLIWHNGSTVGFSSFMGFHSKTKTGVVVLSNYRDGLFQYSPKQIAYDIMNPFLKTNDSNMK
ncbi:serine hydrolase domain-containing protein [Bacillus sp. 179-C3.3 HS]|uniref:serine hydrolase domain-containing protein n=1 Tax=Bacillus sp. 179-C3.3 HS TaxID=3232162 RepID=UPI00399FD728